jgi:CHASE2 domain-containing sensor protein
LEKQANCSNTITGGEVHAYMVHHLLSSHRVLQIPDWWIVGIAALVGKGIALVLIRQSAKQQKKQALIVIGATAVYGLVALQSYISASVLIPWFLPVVLVWADTLLALKRKAYR